MTCACHEPTEPSEGDRLNLLISSYEDLRHQALDRWGHAPWALGLGVLMGRGMAAWLEACSSCVPPGAAPREVVTGPVPMAAGVRNNVVRVLVQMALRSSALGAPSS